MTDDVLSIAAYGADISLDDVRKAFLEVKTKDIKQWKKEHTGKSILVLKKEMKMKMAA